MSLKSRLGSTTNRTQTATSSASGNFRSETCKSYTFTYKDQDESLFDEDDLKSRYLEKELALKRINDELEKKTSEIFKKIDKFHHNDRNFSQRDGREMGQGDTETCSPQTGNYMRMTRCNFDKSTSKSARSLGGFDDLGANYYNDSRSSSAADSISDQAQFVYNSSSGLMAKRPSTAGGLFNPESRRFHTEASLQKVEATTPVLLEGLEEKHQARLQKATESVLKCVQQKLVNYEQRLADMHLQYRQKIQENTMLEAKVKALEEDRKRLLKSVQSLQSTTDKFSKTVENSKMNLNIKAQAFVSLKKEMESLRRDVKQKNGMVQSLQTRLDRCMEENRRMKCQYQSVQLNLKQQHNEDQTTMTELKQRITQLEQQKSNIQSTVEKQAQLIKSLRSHKVEQIG